MITVQCKSYNTFRWVGTEDNLYFIENENLDLTVWAETREEVEKAFSRALYTIKDGQIVVKDGEIVSTKTVPCH